MGGALGSVLYFLPSIIALLRKVPNIGSIAVINIFLGWTFIGWIVALAMSFGSRHEPQVIIQQVPEPAQQQTNPPQ